MRFGQVVVGPAGTGKSTYCRTIREHCLATRRQIYVINLDPAAENQHEDIAVDIRDLIQADEVMEELEYGPNGALVYCMEYLLDNIDWLQGELEGFNDDDYFIFDCPGQMELYSHIPVMRKVVQTLRSMDFNLVSMYLIDATFVVDTTKFIAGSLQSLAAMIQLELPHVNVVTKCDLVDSEELDRVLEAESAVGLASMHERGMAESGAGRLSNLTHAICQVLDDFSLVSYVPLNITDEETIERVLLHADHVIQYGEDLEPKHPDEEDEPDAT